MCHHVVFSGHSLPPLLNKYLKYILYTTHNTVRRACVNSLLRLVWTCVCIELNIREGSETYRWERDDASFASDKERISVCECVIQ